MVIGVLTAFSLQAAVIYKWVDADGVVHFSDQAAPGAEKIFTANAPSGTSAPRVAATGPMDKKPVTAQGYTEFSITAPAANQTFFGDEVIGVHLNMSPALKPNQTITWHLNGKQLDQAPDATGFALPRLDRGTFALAATVTDSQTGETQISNSVTFFVRQPSALSPQHK